MNSRVAELVSDFEARAWKARKEASVLVTRAEIWELAAIVLRGAIREDEARAVSAAILEPRDAV